MKTPVENNITFANAGEFYAALGSIIKDFPEGDNAASVSSVTEQSSKLYDAVVDFAMASETMASLDGKEIGAFLSSTLSAMHDFVEADRTAPESRKMLMDSMFGAGITAVDAAGTDCGCGSKDSQQDSHQGSHMASPF